MPSYPRVLLLEDEALGYVDMNTGNRGGPPIPVCAPSPHQLSFSAPKKGEGPRAGETLCRHMKLRSVPSIHGKSWTWRHMPVISPSPGESEAGGSLGFAGLPVQQDRRAPGSGETLSQKIRQRAMRTPDIDSDLHTHSHTHMLTYIRRRGLIAVAWRMGTGLPRNGDNSFQTRV